MDNKFIIDNLLMQNESEHLEFKAHFDERIVAKDVTAMLNGSGELFLLESMKKRLLWVCH